MAAPVCIHTANISQMFHFFCATLEFTTGNVLVCVLWVGRDRYPASFRPVTHPPEKNPGRALFLFSKGLGARLRKELLSQAWDEKVKVDRPL